MSDNQNYLLNRMDYDSICKLPCDNNPLMVAAQARNRNIRVLTGAGLLRQNVEEFAQTLQMNDRTMINSTTKYIWSLYLTPSQKEEFEDLANKANDINLKIMQINSDNINRISRLTPQVTDDPIMSNFYNGADFQVDGGFESLFPAGHGSTSFP
ncbi:hypothetical protein C1645_795548 [Glomus cerebriforme]|uniref:Uncharacterized protein n=1 Tax=Glomus cerebriforme TaxID=658196 RepID=A0A397S2P8_9GLOM|nr:hypothetical protein C1645_795548 [Glomus cerebriforme]